MSSDEIVLVQSYARHAYHALLNLANHREFEAEFWAERQLPKEALFRTLF